MALGFPDPIKGTATALGVDPDTYDERMQQAGIEEYATGTPPAIGPAGLSAPASLSGWVGRIGVVSALETANPQSTAGDAIRRETGFPALGHSGGDESPWWTEYVLPALLAGVALFLLAPVLELLTALAGGTE